MNSSNLSNDSGSSQPDNNCNEPTNRSEATSESNELEEQTEEQNSDSDGEGKRILIEDKEDVTMDQAGPSTKIDQAGPSSEIDQARPTAEIGSSVQRGAIIHMKRDMSKFRHCGLENLLETYLGELAEKIRQSTLRLVNNPTTRRYIPLLLSPLVELGVYNIVFPDGGIPYFFVGSILQHNEHVSNAEKSSPDLERTEDFEGYEDLVEIGTASHLPPDIDCFSPLVIPRDFSGRSYIHMQGGFPLDIPQGTDMRVDPSADIIPPTELQKKMPLLSNLLDLNKPPALEMNDPILTAMFNTPPIDFEDCVGLSKHFSISRDTSMVKARKIILQEAFKLMRKQNPSLAQAWALKEDEVNRILAQPGKATFNGVTNDDRSGLLNEILEWLEKNQPRLYSAWKEMNEFSVRPDLPMTSWVDRCHEQIPRTPVELLVYNLHVAENTTPPPDEESPELSSADEQDQTEPQQASAQPAAQLQQQQPEAVGHLDDSQEEHVEQVGPMDDSQEEEDSSEQLVINENVANHNDQMDVDQPMDNISGPGDRSLKAQIEFMGQLPPASVNILVEPNIWFKERITAAIIHEPGSDGTIKPIHLQPEGTIAPISHETDSTDAPMTQPSTSGTNLAHTTTSQAIPEMTQACSTATQSPTTEPQGATASGSQSISNRVEQHPITLALLNSPTESTASPTIEQPAVEVQHSSTCPAAAEGIQGSSETPSENQGCSCGMPPPSGPLSPTKRKRLDSATTSHCQESSGSSTGSSPVGNPPSPTKKFRRQSPRLLKLRENQGSSSGSSQSNDPLSPLKQLHLSTCRGSRSQVPPNTPSGIEEEQASPVDITTAIVPPETPDRMEVEVLQESPSPVPVGGRQSRSLKRKGGDPNLEAGPSREKQQASHASPEVRQALQESILERRLLYGTTVNPEQLQTTLVVTEGTQTEVVIDLTESPEEHLRERQESERSEGADTVRQAFPELIRILNAPPKEKSQEESKPDANPGGEPEIEQSRTSTDGTRANYERLISQYEGLALKVLHLQCSKDAQPQSTSEDLCRPPSHPMTPVDERSTRNHRPRPPPPPMSSRMAREIRYNTGNLESLGRMVQDIIDQVDLPSERRRCEEGVEQRVHIPTSVPIIEPPPSHQYTIPTPTIVIHHNEPLQLSDNDFRSPISEAEAAEILVSLSNPVSSPDSAESVQISPAVPQGHIQTSHEAGEVQISPAQQIQSSHEAGGVQISPAQHQELIPASITSRNTPMTMEEYNRYVDHQQSSGNSDSEISPYSKSWYVTTSGTRVKRFQEQGTPRPQACRNLFNELGSRTVQTEGSSRILQMQPEHHHNIPASRTTRETPMTDEEYRQYVEQQGTSCSDDATNFLESSERIRISSEHDQEHAPGSISSRNSPMTSEEYQQYIEQQGISTIRDTATSPSSRSDPGKCSMENATFKIPTTPTEGVPKRNPKRRSDPPKPNTYPMSRNIRRSTSLPGIQVLPPPPHLQRTALHYVPQLGAPFRLSNHPIRQTVQPFISMARNMTERARNNCPIPAHLHRLRKDYPEQPIPQPRDLTTSRNPSIERGNEQQSSEIQKNVATPHTNEAGSSMSTNPDVGEHSIHHVKIQGSSRQENSAQEIPRNVTKPYPNTVRSSLSVSPYVVRSIELDTQETQGNVVTPRSNTAGSSMTVSSDIGAQSIHHVQIRGLSTQEQSAQVTIPRHNAASSSLSVGSHVVRSMEHDMQDGNQETQRNVAPPRSTTAGLSMTVSSDVATQSIHPVQRRGFCPHQQSTQETRATTGPHRFITRTSASEAIERNVNQTRDSSTEGFRGEETQRNVAPPPIVIRNSTREAIERYVNQTGDFSTERDSYEEARRNLVRVIAETSARADSSPEGFGDGPGRDLMRISMALGEHRNDPEAGINRFRAMWENVPRNRPNRTNPSMVVSIDMGEHVYHAQRTTPQRLADQMMRRNSNIYNVRSLESVEQEQIDRMQIYESAALNITTSSLIVSDDMGEQIIFVPRMRGSEQRWSERNVYPSRGYRDGRSGPFFRLSDSASTEHITDWTGQYLCNQGTSNVGASATESSNSRPSNLPTSRGWRTYGFLEETRSSSSAIGLSYPGESYPRLPIPDLPDLGPTLIEPSISEQPEAGPSTREYFNLGSCTPREMWIWSPINHQPILGPSNLEPCIIDPLDPGLSTSRNMGNSGRAYSLLEPLLNPGPSIAQASNTEPLNLTTYNIELPNHRSSNPGSYTSRGWGSLVSPELLSTSATPSRETRRFYPWLSNRESSDPGPSTSRGSSGFVERSSISTTLSKETRRSSSSKRRSNPGPSNQESSEPGPFTSRGTSGSTERGSNSATLSKETRKSSSSKRRSNLGPSNPESSDPGPSTSRGSSGSAQRGSNSATPSKETWKSSSSKQRSNPGPSNRGASNLETSNLGPELRQPDLAPSVPGPSRSRGSVSSASAKKRSSSANVSKETKISNSNKKRCKSTPRKKKDEEILLIELFPFHCIYCHQICKDAEELMFHQKTDCVLIVKGHKLDYS